MAAIVVELGLQSCAVLARYPTRDAICRRVRITSVQLRQV